MSKRDRSEEQLLKGTPTTPLPMAPTRFSYSSNEAKFVVLNISCVAGNAL